MANPSRKKRKRKASVVGAVLKLLFLLLLLSMLAAYIANQVALSSKKAELDTLQEQIDQQKTQNEEMQRILSGDSDDVTEWVARDSPQKCGPCPRGPPAAQRMRQTVLRR